MNAGPPANFNFADFSSALSELIQIFRQDLGGSVTPKELGPNTRLMCLTQQGLEHSDALYKEFYPRKETGEIKRSIVVLKEIAQARLNSVYQPNRRPMSNSSPTQMSSSAAANDNFSLNDFSKAMLEILRYSKMISVDELPIQSSVRMFDLQCLREVVLNIVNYYFKNFIQTERLQN